MRSRSREVLLIAALAALSLAPFLLVATPPLVDLPGHMGRYFVQLNLARSPLLQRDWAFHWRLSGNLGIDLLIGPLSQLLGLERAVWLIAATLPPLMIWGLARISWAIHGRISPFMLAATPFVFAYPFQFGFLNDWLSTALALHAFASWVGASSWGAWRRALVFAPAAALIWLCHVYGWAILLVLAGAWELERAWTARPSQWPAMTARISARLWPIGLPILLVVLWRHGESGGGGTANFFNPFLKLEGLVFVLRDQNMLVDLASLIFASGLIYFMVRQRQVRIEPGLALAAWLFALLAALLPFSLFGSDMADTRLIPVAFMIALTSGKPRLEAWRPARTAGALALILFLGRLALMAQGFMDYDRDFRQHLQALDHVPQGASIAVLRPARCAVSARTWRTSRLDHLDSLAIVRRSAFVNSQWSIPGAQSLEPLHATGTDFNADPSEVVRRPLNCALPLTPQYLARLKALPRAKFDYLWLLDFDLDDLPPPKGMTRLYGDSRSALYRINR